MYKGQILKYLKLKNHQPCDINCFWGGHENSMNQHFTLQGKHTSNREAGQASFQVLHYPQGVIVELHNTLFCLIHVCILPIEKAIS